MLAGGRTPLWQIEAEGKAWLRTHLSSLKSRDFTHSR